MSAAAIEQRLLAHQRIGDGQYLGSQWDSADALYLRELYGAAWGLLCGNESGRSERRAVRVLHYGCGAGAVFRGLQENLGHLFEFHFIGIDPDWRALGFVQAKFPSAETHAADLEEFCRLAWDGVLSADLAIGVMACYGLAEEPVGRFVAALSRIAPQVLLADQVDNIDGKDGALMQLSDSTGRDYEAYCPAFASHFRSAGYRSVRAWPAREPSKSLSGFLAASRDTLPPLEGLMDRARTGDFGKPDDGPAPAARGAPKVNAYSVSMAETLADIDAHGFRSIAVYADHAFHEDFSHAARERLPGVTITWFSSHFEELEDGALHLNKSALAQGALNPTTEALKPYDCIVTGGRSAPLFYPRLLRLMGRARYVVPVLPVVENWEFVVSQISFPEEIDNAHAYLFNHFQEYFGIRDPILARLEVYDHQGHVHEDWILLQPYESIKIDLNERLPDRHGPCMVAVRAVAPFLTRGRHYRWRFCADCLWKGSIATLHGAHDIPHDSAGTEFIQARSAFSQGHLVFTLPNHYADMSDRGIKVDYLVDERIQTVERDRQRRIEQIRLPLGGASEPKFGDFVGARFHQYTTPFWFAMEDPGGRANLSANHIQGQSFEFLTKPEPRIPLGELEQSLLEHDIVTWPYCVPVFPAESGLEMGFSFDSSWPVLRRFKLRFFDGDGTLRDCIDWTKDRPGLVFADELAGLSERIGRDEVSMLLLAPDWAGMNIDQQANKVSPIVDLALRSRLTGDFDITEFQNSWRNLGVMIREMPHWIHFSNHLLGGTNLYSRVVARPGWRCGAVLVNGSGNLKYDTDIDFTIKVFNSQGDIFEAPMVLKAFCQKLVWLDEVVPDLEKFLGQAGFGAFIIRSKTGDLNGQLVTTVDHGRSVSLQHMWGY